MRVCDLIRTDSDGIVAEWASAARRQVQPAATMPQLALLNQVPDLLRELADWLESRGQDSVGPYCPKAPHHTMDQLPQDCDLGQVVHEFRILRGIIVRRLVAVQHELDNLDEFARMDEALDLAVAEAVDRFSAARERILMSKAERAQLALDAADLAMWEWYPKDGLMKWDARTRALLGLPPGASVTYNVSLSTLHPDDRDRIDAIARDHVSGRAGDESRVEYRTLGADGVERWIESRGRVLARDEHGHAVRFLGTALDITERKRMEQDLAQTAEIREHFVAIASHDLRNPLNAIRMAATMLIKSEELPQSLGRNVGRIIANADRMTRLIADLLDLTRGHLGGGIPVERMPTNLHDIAPAMLETLELARPGRQIETQARGDLTGQWDPDRVAQALGNLVTNALDHGDPRAAVRVELVGADDHVSILVHNQGRPIPQDEQAHLFEPFRRAARREGPGGLGLGLYITREIVRAHDGSIAASSTEKDGTTFRIELPRAPQAR
jgi:PAS domain S-box-containing protein